MVRLAFFLLVAAPAAALRLHGAVSDQHTLDMPSVHFIYTTGCDEYQLIQSIVLDHSWREVGNRGKLTRIVGGCKPEQKELLARSPLQDDPDFAVFFAEGDLAVVPDTGERYPARARPVSIEQWLAAANPQEEVVAILDPDQMSVRPLSAFPNLAKVKDGLMVAAQYAHGSTWFNFASIGEEEPNITSYDKERTYATGPPWMLTTSDLKRMIKPWTYYTDHSAKERVGDLMREQEAFNMAALKLNIPSTHDENLMVSFPGVPMEAWSEGDTKDWKPYVLHFDGSYEYGSWQLHKALTSNGWYAASFSNTLPTVIECGAPVLEVPPSAPTKEEEPDRNKLQHAWMLANLLPGMKKAVMAYRAKYCNEDTSKLGFMRVMQPACNSQTRYLVERPSESWTETYPLGGATCSEKAQHQASALLEKAQDIHH